MKVRKEQHVRPEQRRKHLNEAEIGHEEDGSDGRRESGWKQPAGGGELLHSKSSR